MMDDLQKQTAQAIVNIFETGKPQGDYGCVTLLQGDSGHLTYGRAQLTLASGNLHRLINAYCALPDAPHASALHAYLPRLAVKDFDLDHDRELRRLLTACGDAPQMRRLQDRFFDQHYWLPAMAKADEMACHEMLSRTIIYDSMIHGSFRRIAARVDKSIGAARSVSERAWMKSYVSARRDWLSHHTNRLLRQTVYRMDTFQSLIAEGNWSLELPLHVRGIRLNPSIFLDDPVAYAANKGSQNTTHKTG